MEQAQAQLNVEQPTQEPQVVLLESANPEAQASRQLVKATQQQQVKQQPQQLTQVRAAQVRSQSVESQSTQSLTAVLKKAPAETKKALMQLEQAQAQLNVEQPTQEPQAVLLESANPEAQASRQLKLAESNRTAAVAVLKEARMGIPLTASAPARLTQPLRLQTVTIKRASKLDTTSKLLELPGTVEMVELPDVKLNVGANLESDPEHDNPLILRNPKVRSNYIERLGGSEETEKAVRRALDWFTRNQEKDGHWRGQAGHTSAATGMAMLAYMGWGAKHSEPGPYQKPLAKAVDWLLRHERNGDLRGRGDMYDHGIAAIALAEAYSLTKDSRLRRPVERVIAFTVRAQNPKSGGWRYRPYKENPREKGDMSVTGWQLMALRSAQLGGFEVPDRVFDRTKSFLEYVAEGKQGGDYRYLPRRKRNVAMISEGMFCQQLLYLPPASRRMRESAQYIQNDLPSQRNVNYYYWYYGSLAMHQNQGEPWENWNEKLRPILVRNQIRNAGHEDGSWDPTSEWGPEAGRCVITAMATLSLEVYYRYLPLSSPAWLNKGK